MAQTATYDVTALATSVAERARDIGRRPHQVVDEVLNQKNIPTADHFDLRSKVLSELGRRGGKRAAVKKRERELEKAMREAELADEMHHRALEANEDICPLAD